MSGGQLGQGAIVKGVIVWGLNDIGRIVQEGLSGGDWHGGQLPGGNVLGAISWG